MVHRLQDAAKKFEDVLEKELSEREDFCTKAENTLGSLEDLLDKLNGLVSSIGPQVADAEDKLQQCQVGQL